MAAMATNSIAQGGPGEYDGSIPESFDRRFCHSNVLKYLNTKSPNPTYFHQGFIPGNPDSDSMILLSMEGCRVLCGEGTLYYDWLARFTVWTIPILLLMANVQLAPVAKKRFASIMHALGDPVDSLWSMIHKSYVWHRLYEIALEAIKDQDARMRRASLREPWMRAERRVTKETIRRARTIATVLSGFEEVCAIKAESEQFYRDIVDTFYPRGDSETDRLRRRKWSEAATSLVGGRPNDFLRTTLALVIYYFGIASALVEKLGGGGGTPPGGRIASALFLSWLVPLVLLSNTFGSFSDRRVCIDILIRFLDPVPGETIQHGNSLENLPCSLVRDWNDYFDSVMWMGYMPTFRPWKVMYRCHSNKDTGHTGTSRNDGRCNAALLAMAAIFPAFVSMFSSGFIVWFAVPAGFNVRHIWIAGVFLVWLFSSFLTSWLYPRMEGKKHWWWIFFKDLFVLLCTTGLPAASTVGAFNNCRGWSSDWMHQNGYVPIGIEQAYRERQDRVYKWVIILAQVSQVLFYLGIIGWWRHGIKVVRWSEKHIRREWNQDRPPWSAMHAYYLRLVVGDLTGGPAMHGTLRGGMRNDREFGSGENARVAEVL